MAALLETISQSPSIPLPRQCFMWPVLGLVHSSVAHWFAASGARGGRLEPLPLHAPFPLVKESGPGEEALC